MGVIVTSLAGDLLNGADGEETVGAALSDQFDEALTDKGLGVSPIVGATFDF